MRLVPARWHFGFGGHFEHAGSLGYGGVPELGEVLVMPLSAIAATTAPS